MGQDDSPRADVGNLPFTDEALRLLADADREASRLGHEHLGTEHLVLAMAPTAGDPAGDFLAGLGIDGTQVRPTLGAALARGAATATPGRAHPRTSRTQRALAFAAESARDLGHARVGPAHLLVGLVREGLGIGAQALQHHGLTAAAAHAHAAGPAEGGQPPVA